MDIESTSVSIGKFPADYTEDQILTIAKSVGPVEQLKLLFDDLTGKSKGYAIIKYGDSETAASAVRNLNYMALPNNRYLRCTFVDDGTADNEKLPLLPLGIQIHPNQSPQLVITNTVQSINQQAALQILQDIKKMATFHPNLTKVLLDKFPQLAQALVELSVISSTTNTDLIELTLNKKYPDLSELHLDQVNLLRLVYAMTPEEIECLDEAKQAVIAQLKTEIDKGSYGEILATN